MKPAKVCLIAKYFYPHDTRLAQQVDTLERYGVPCDLICGNNGTQEVVEKIGSVTIYRVFKLRAEKQSFFIYLLLTFTFLRKTILKLIALSIRNDYRVIVVHTLPEFLVFTTLINKLFGSTIILDGRDITVDLLASRWRRKGIAVVRMVAIFVEKLVTGMCDEIITASSGFKRSLVSRGVPEEKIKVMVNTADETIFRFDSGRTFTKIAEQARLIYHGTVSERFGLLVAVKAMKTICKEIPGSVLHIFGFFDPAYRKKIEEYIYGAKLEESVKLCKPLPLEEIQKQILTMDLGVVPYLSDTFMNLALSTKTFEYIAAGLPVTASRLKSSEELFDDSCIQYAESGNSDDLAEKIIRMCLDPEAREGKRNQAFAVFNKYYTSAAQSEMYVNMLAPYLGIESAALVHATR